MNERTNERVDKRILLILASAYFLRDLGAEIGLLFLTRVFPVFFKMSSRNVSLTSFGNVGLQSMSRPVLQRGTCPGSPVRARVEGIGLCIPLLWLSTRGWGGQAEGVAHRQNRSGMGL